jgi:hypothetical protein
MKILLNESQLNRVILENNIKDTITGKKSEKGLVIVDEIDVSQPIGKFVPKNRPSLIPKVQVNFYLNIKNISNNTNPIIIESVNLVNNEQFDDYRFRKTPLMRGDVGMIFFSWTPTNTDDAKMYKNLKIEVNLIVGNSKVRDKLVIDFSYDVLPSSQKINYCKSKFNPKTLKPAIDWYKQWLSNPITKQKFAKIWKYDMNKVETIFSDYFKILDQIRFDYVFSSATNGGWVRDTVLGKLSISKGGFDVPITVNCRVAQNYDEEGDRNFIIHEIKHILDYLHKLHPYKSDAFTFYSDKIGNPLRGPIDSKILNNIKQNLIDEGFINVDEIVRSYMWRLENDEYHLKNKNEIFAALYGIREKFKISPGQPITKDHLINYNSNSDVIDLICIYIYSGMKLQDWLDQYNSVAMNQNKRNNNLA